jgi:hypothetical protein
MRSPRLITTVAQGQRGIDVRGEEKHYPTAHQNPRQRCCRGFILFQPVPPPLPLETLYLDQRAHSNRNIRFRFKV